jgi:phenylpyruvate tautomerase PptA (4-oxalocrotonate tautomerase family)
MRVIAGDVTAAVVEITHADRTLKQVVISDENVFATER